MANILDMFKKGFSPLGNLLAKSVFDKKDDIKDSNEGSEDKEQISLTIGSDEYIEYMLDKQGLDELSQERVHDGLRAVDPFERSEDRVQELLYLRNSNYEKEMELGNISNESPYKKETDRRVQNQIKKDTRKRELELEALRQAKKTETLEDDKRALSIDERSDDMVYDDEVTPSEYIPKALKKYM